MAATSATSIGEIPFPSVFATTKRLLREIEAMHDQVESALDSALKAVDLANSRIIKVLEEPNEPGHRNAIIETLREEVAKHPGFLNEVIDLLRTQNSHSATQSPQARQTANRSR